ncbi:MAG: DUF1697 domain-containing protein [Acidimicrobiales bacterium]
MTTRVGFLRAVNVGRRTVPMGRLAELVEGLGHTDVWTYLNSGNVVFDATGSRTAIESSIETALEVAFGFEVTTFVRSAAELREVLQVDPFTLSEGDTYFVTFLKQAPSGAVAAELEAASNDFDTLQVHGREVHWRMRGRSTETTLGRKTWNLVGENGSTSRNITMLHKLVAKIDG